MTDFQSREYADRYKLRVTHEPERQVGGGMTEPEGFWFWADRTTTGRTITVKITMAEAVELREWLAKAIGRPSEG